MKKTVVALLGFLLLINFTYAQSKKKSGKLDKRTYDCAVVPNSDKDAMEDELKFAGGTFQCRTLSGEGFKASPYDAVSIQVLLLLLSHLLVLPKMKKRMYLHGQAQLPEML